MLHVVSEASNTRKGSNNPVLELRLASLVYGDTPILGAVSLTVDRSETLALVGPSGVGKTSLLRIVAGLETRYRGTCRVNGKVGMVFQEPTLLPWRTVGDNICIATGISKAEAEQALAEVGLEGRGQDFPSQLSLGQQRRLSLARAFAAKPDLLLMDEPFVSLDPSLVEEMMVLFAKLRATHKVTTILVTHVVEEATKLASRVVTLGGSPAQMTGDVQNKGAYFQLSASGVTSSKS
ncbi:ABC transporter ATP-binding protein [Litoreibacter janthinus]|uniref:NitT/TauT family transport system ATP-binding protein n=1 Tax=Litoreibacter janthinus TaxID=670154 RepID=A0A1I6GUJ6_9RHOB|nr:ABC transporter ATP-binding protein [Litoreibacter janthinus]SFR45914.1 NitT/TauT family transport system ATP-binding protein [Litoreibacter janthinus]